MNIEELLNKLIEKGRVPFGLEGVNKVKYAEQYYRNYSYVFYGGGWQQWRSLRQIVSMESNLRQFCCENNLINKYADISDEEEAYIGKRKSGLDAIDIDGNYIRLDDDYDEYHQDTDYKYWLIESALKDEGWIEAFLLNNIKV